MAEDRFGPGYPGYIRIDECTRGMLSIDYIHYQIHKENAYSAYYTTDIANGGTINILMATDADSVGSFTGSVDVELETHIVLYEGVTATATDNSIPLYNRYRDSTNTPTLTITHSPTGITTGIVKLFEAHPGSGKKAGGSRGDGQEWRVRADTKYLLQIVNIATSANYVTVFISWLEHIC